MNRTLLTHAIAVLVTAAVVCSLWFLRASHAAQESSAGQLAFVKQLVEQQLAARTEGLARQVAGFSSVVANDRDFSMKLLVDMDKSAPEVTEIARRYQDPMDCQLLSITDSQYVLLSCGQFPASVGTVAPLLRLLGDRPAYVLDNVKGRTVLSLQAKTRFTILDAHFFASAGKLVDEQFIASLCCPSGYKVIIKQGKNLIGMDRIETISDVKNNTIIINNTTFRATSFALPYSGDGDAPVCIVYSTAPLK